jgi:hypothetical protein
MTRSKYLLVMAALLGWVASLEYVPRFPDGPLCIGCVLIVVVLILSAFISQKWITLAALSFLLIGSIVGPRWRYLLVVGTLTSWLAMHLLNYVSSMASWPIDLFKVCWLALFFLALVLPFRRRWYALAISCLALFVTFGAFVDVFLGPEGGVLPNRWLQETGFRIYGSHLIRSAPLEEFLSRCKLVDYIEEDSTKQQVGECGDGLRSTLWFQITVIYDPSGQVARPAIQRTLAWRLAVLHLPTGSFFVHDDVASYLDGNFYWILAPPDLSGDNGR